jgi:hypothetical protein
MSTGMLVAGPLPKIGRQELAQIPVPEATLTHKPVLHHVIVEALVETVVALMQFARKGCEQEHDRPDSAQRSEWTGASRN